MDLIQDKKFEVSIKALTDKYVGLNGNYVKFMPENISNVDEFYTRPYVTSVNPYQTKMAYDNNFNVALVNLINPYIINQLSDNKVGKQAYNNFMDEVGLNPDFQRAFFAIAIAILSQYSKEELDKRAGFYANNMLNMYQDNFLTDETHILNSLQTIYPTQTKQIKFEEVKEGDKKGFVNKLKEMKNRFAYFVKDKVNTLKEGMEQLREDGVLDEIEDKIHEKIDSAKEAVKAGIKKTKDAFIKLGKGIVKTSTEVVKTTEKLAVKTFKATADAVESVVAPISHNNKKVSEMAVGKDLEM